MAALPTFPTFDLKTGDLGREWRKYVARSENMLLAMNITNATRKKAMLLHYVGEEDNEIFETLEVQETDDTEDVFIKAEKALKNYFTSQKNLEFEVYKFRQAKQIRGENIFAYFTRLKQLSKYCEFHDEKREIKTQIIQNGISSKLRRKALAYPDITLEKVQAGGIENANRIQKKTSRREINQQRNENQQKSKCRFCGYQHVLGKNNCPAYGKQCRGCLKWDHFKACCNEKRQGSKQNEQSKSAMRSEANNQNEMNRRNLPWDAVVA